MVDQAPQQSYATFAAHHARIHTPTRLVFCYPATDHSLHMARERVTDALYDFDMPMATLAHWLAYIADAAADMAVDEVWAWAILDWSELIIALDDDMVLRAFVDMSRALYARGVECELDDAILDAFKEAHLMVAQVLAGKPSHAAFSKMLKSWWSLPAASSSSSPLPPAPPPASLAMLISNGNLANGNPLLGDVPADARAPPYPDYQRSFYRSVVTAAWQLAAERRLQGGMPQHDNDYDDDDDYDYGCDYGCPMPMCDMTTIAIGVPITVVRVDVDTHVDAALGDDVDSTCTYAAPSAGAAARALDKPGAPAVVDVDASRTVAKWPMEPTVAKPCAWNVLDALHVAPVATLAYRPSWLERRGWTAPAEGEADAHERLDITCDLQGSLVSQRRPSDADSLCSLTTVPFSDRDDEEEEEAEELASPVPTAKTLLQAPLDAWMVQSHDAGSEAEDDGWRVYAPVVKEHLGALVAPWCAQGKDDDDDEMDRMDVLSATPSCIAMMDASLRASVFTEETTSTEHEFNRLVGEIKRRRMVAA